MTDHKADYQREFSHKPAVNSAIENEHEGTGRNGNQGRWAGKMGKYKPFCSVEFFVCVVQLTIVSSDANYQYWKIKQCRAP